MLVRVQNKAGVPITVCREIIEPYSSKVIETDSIIRSNRYISVTKLEETNIEDNTKTDSIEDTPVEIVKKVPRKRTKKINTEEPKESELM